MFQQSDFQKLLSNIGACVSLFCGHDYLWKKNSNQKLKDKLTCIRSSYQHFVLLYYPIVMLCFYNTAMKTFFSFFLGFFAIVT